MKKNSINNNINKNNLNNCNIYNRNYNRNNINNLNNMSNNSDCKEIKLLKNLVIDSYSNLWRNDTFVIFKSIKNFILLIYTNEKKSIISFDIINNKKINEIYNAHQEYITNFRYYLDFINKRDLILSISSYDNHLKLWNININNIFECLLDIKDIIKKVIWILHVS